MSRRITTQISLQVLQELFKQCDIWNRIHDKTLTTVLLYPVPSKTYKGGISRILLHFNRNGKHVASTHRIIDERTGLIFHWDEKGIQLNDVWLERS